MSHIITTPCRKYASSRPLDQLGMNENNSSVTRKEMTAKGVTMWTATSKPLKRSINCVAHSWSATLFSFRPDSDWSSKDFYHLPNRRGRWTSQGLWAYPESSRGPPPRSYRECLSSRVQPARSCPSRCRRASFSAPALSTRTRGNLRRPPAPSAARP